MTNEKLKNLTIEKARKMLDEKEISVKELVNYYLDNIKEKNEDLNIFLSIFKNIDEQVKKAQAKIDVGEADILTGIPFAVKPNIAIKGENTNAASKILEDYNAPYDATVISRLKKQDVIFLGYVNADEFACGGSGEHSAYGITKNPISPKRVPGGSSSGSAAAVAADMALVSLGTDTGGSIRQPASFCGLVGVKPTYGRVSRHGAAAMGSSLDQISPLTRTVKDSKIVLNIIAGEDEYDMTSLSKENNSGENFLDEKKGLKKKIGIPRKFLKDLNPVISQRMKEIEENFKQKGYEIIDIDLDIFKYALPVYYILMPAEVSSNLSRYDGIRYGSKKEGENIVDEYFQTKSLYGEEVKRRIILGTYILSEGYADQYYNRALVLREKIREEYKKVINDLDAVIFPTAPTPAFKIGENDDPINMYLADIYTVSSSIIGNPAISVPAGNIEWEGENLPFGLQILAAHEKENILYKVAKDFEKNLKNLN